MADTATTSTVATQLTDPNTVTAGTPQIRRDAVPAPYWSTFDELDALPPLVTLAPSSESLADLAPYVAIASGVDRRVFGLRVVFGLFANVNREHREHGTNALMVWPGDDTIAAGAGCSTKSVQRVRDDLTRAGVVLPDRSKVWTQATATGPGEPQQPDARTYPTRVVLDAAQLYAAMVLNGAIASASAFAKTVRRWVRAARKHLPELPAPGRGPVCGSRSVLRRRGRSRPGLPRANVDTAADVGTCERGHEGRANVDTPADVRNALIGNDARASREVRETPRPADPPTRPEPRPTMVRHDAAATARPCCSVCDRPFAASGWTPTDRICRDCRADRRTP